MEMVGLRNGSRRSRGLDSSRHRSSAIAIDLGLGAVARDVARLAASVAGLARRVEGTTVGSGAVAGDVAQLSTSVALHGLRLAVTRKVVWATALVASGRTTTTETSPEASSVSATGSGSAAESTGGRARAVAGQVAREATGVAASAGATAAQAQRRAVSLDVAEALAVVALLRLSGAWVRASIGLVAGLLA